MIDCKINYTATGEYRPQTQHTLSLSALDKWIEFSGYTNKKYTYHKGTSVD